MTRKLHVAALVAVVSLMPLGAAQAQSSTTTATTTGSFDTLSPGNQKIARALFNAQQPSATSPAPLDLNQIADLKGKTGWGNVFKQMKSEGLVDARNLGQVVSGYEHTLTHSATLGTGNSDGTLAVTTGSGHTTTTGPGHSNGIGSEVHGSAGIGHHEEAMTITNAGGSSVVSAGVINGGGNGHAAGGGGVGGGHGH